MGNSFSAVAFLGAWLTTIGGVWFLFEKADETLAPEVRAKLSAWLRNLSPTHTSHRWPTQFIALFDRTFGTKRFSWLRLRRSASASFIVSWIVGAWWIATHPPPSAGIGGEFMLMVSVMTLLYSVVPDYLSLLETRLVLGRMSRGGSTLPWLVLDALATALLGVLPYLLTVVWSIGLAGIPKMTWQLITFQVTMLVRDALPSGADEVIYAMPMAPFFYATFFTSAWVWLFATAGALVRLLKGLFGGFAKLKGMLDIEQKPGRSLGLAAVLLVTVLYALAVPILLLLPLRG